MNRSDGLRWLCLAVALLLSAIPGMVHAQTSTHPRQSSAVFSDSFASNTIDPATWTTDGDGIGPVVIPAFHHVSFITRTPTESTSHGSAMPLLTGLDTQSSNHTMSLYLDSRCKVDGDLDIRVTYRLRQTPSTGSIAVALQLTRSSASGFPGESIDRFAGQSNAYGFTSNDVESPVDPTLAPRGTLRLVRQGATLTRYYLKDGTWQQVATGDAPAGPVWFGFGLHGDDLGFSHGTIDVEFDTVTMTQGHFTTDCRPPTWSHNLTAQRPTGDISTNIVLSSLTPVVQSSVGVSGSIADSGEAVQAIPAAVVWNIAGQISSCPLLTTDEYGVSGCSQFIPKEAEGQTCSATIYFLYEGMIVSQTATFSPRDLSTAGGSPATPAAGSGTASSSSTPAPAVSAPASPTTTATTQPIATASPAHPVATTNTSTAQPTATPAATATTPPTSMEATGPLSVRLWVQPQTVTRNSNATLYAQSAPGAQCVVSITYDDGTAADTPSLGPKTAGADGTVSWTWQVSGSAKSAVASVGCVSGNDEAFADTRFSIGG